MIGMSPTYHIGRATVLRGNAAALPLPDSSVDLIVTSPPYWSLRSYTDDGEAYAGQIGAEPTWQEYIDNLIRCTREWVRVLKPTGSLFVNLGDKYNSAASGQNLRDAAGKDGRGPKRYDGGRGERAQGIPAKSLLDLPWRYSIRCVDELGLIKRAEIIWGKLNGLPESVTDRVRRSHEVFLHLTKAPRYFSAVDEIREASTPQRGLAGTFKRPQPSHTLVPGQAATQHRADRADAPAYNPLGKLPGSVWEIATEPLKVPDHISHAVCCDGRKRPGCEDGVGHFAAFPTEWPRRLIQGWSPSGICTACGEGRRPVSTRADLEPNDRLALATRARTSTARGTHVGSTLGYSASAADRTITGEACACTPYTDHDPEGLYGKPWREWHVAGWQGPPTRPAVVLDPFGGTGTTALVASVLGRHGISGDMSADYCRLARWRTTDPGQRAKAARVATPPKVHQDQGDLFAGLEVVA